MNNVSFTVEILPLWLYGHVPLVSRFPQKVKQLQCCWLEQTRFFFVLFFNTQTEVVQYKYQMH